MHAIRPLALAALLAGALALPLAPTATATVPEAILASGTLTMTRQATGCADSDATFVAATFSSGILVALQAESEDGFLRVEGSGALGSYQAIGEWCSALAGTGPLAASVECADGALAFTLASPGVVLSFTSSSGQCLARKGNGLIALGPRTDPEEVAIAGPGDPEVLGCAGFVTVSMADVVATVPSFAATCDEAALCAAYVALPGVRSCARSAFPPPQVVARPGVGTVAVACLWTQWVSVDADGDGVAEAAHPVRTLDPGPCPA